MDSSDVVLVTGGLGYIGSITCAEMIRQGYKLAIVDNMSRCDAFALHKLQRVPHADSKSLRFYKVDVKDRSALKNVFVQCKPCAVIHFAGVKSVEESIYNPLMYYEENVGSLLNIVHLCKEYSVQKLVFSSSATVYGSNTTPFVETMDRVESSNTYGKTKQICEQIIEDIAAAGYGVSATILRYFNPVGADTAAMLGEPYMISRNLVPCIIRAVLNESVLRIYGHDYDTIDGTCARDYLHVCDLAAGHVAALNYAPEGLSMYNLGTGIPHTVLDVVHEFEHVIGRSVSYSLEKRRVGDMPICYALVDKAKKELHWDTPRSLADMLADAWHYATGVKA